MSQIDPDGKLLDLIAKAFALDDRAKIDDNDLQTAEPFTDDQVKRMLTRALQKFDERNKGSEMA